jgi:hypothetical protein
MKFSALVILLVGLAQFASAAVAAPEIDSSSAYGAVALLSGALLVLRARRK